MRNKHSTEVLDKQNWQVGEDVIFNLFDKAIIGIVQEIDDDKFLTVKFGGDKNAICTITAPYQRFAKVTKPS